MSRMRWRGWFAAAAAVLIGCSLESPQAPVIEEAGELPWRAAKSVTPCPQGYVCVAATNSPASVDLDSVAAYCQSESCSVSSGASALSVTTDEPGEGLADLATFQCPNNVIAKLLSNGSLLSGPGQSGQCWDCFFNSGCAGANCPAGAICKTTPGVAGSDCRAFTCSGNYEVYASGDNLPTCRRLAPPAAPSTSAANVHGLPKLTWSAVSGAEEYRVYRRTNVDSWELVMTSDSPFIDGSTEVAGAPQSYAPSGAWVAYRVTSYSSAGGEGSPGPTHYFTWESGGGPY